MAWPSKQSFFYLSLFHAVAFIHSSVKQWFIYLLFLKYLLCFTISETIVQHFLINHDTDCLFYHTLVSDVNLKKYICSLYLHKYDKSHLCPNTASWNHLKIGKKFLPTELTHNLPFSSWVLSYGSAVLLISSFSLWWAFRFSWHEYEDGCLLGCCTM
jgi:hypothetical protein